MSEQPNLVFGALLAAAAVLATSVLVGLILLGGEGAPEFGATVIGVFSACIVFLLGLGNVPFSSIVILLFATVSAAGFVRVLRAYRRERRLLAALPLEPVDDGPLAVRAREAGVRLVLLRSERPFAFCHGLLRPRVAVSTGLLERLDADEEEAVVWHEAVHARGREPLKCLVARLCTETFFWLPALRGLLDRYLLVKELAADRAAVARTSRRALAGALTVAVAQTAPGGTVGLAESAAVRVDRLFEPHVRLPGVFRPGRLLVSGVAVGVLALSLLFPSTLSTKESEQIWAMLSAMSVHGLPGMLAGLITNLGVLAGVAVLAHRLAR